MLQRHRPPYEQVLHCGNLIMSPVADANPFPTIEPLVRTEGVGKRYEIAGGSVITALQDVNLSVPKGAVTAVTGPSGSGKSTLLHVIGAMDVPDEGRIVVGGTEVTGLSPKKKTEYRRRIGFVFQRFHLLSALTAADNVAAPLFPYKIDFDLRQRAEELLASVGLEGRGDSLPSRLSGGEQQRVAIARALINEPILLLADEPTGNLDSKTSDEIMDLLLRLREEHEATILVATHDPLIASRCDAVVRIRDGLLVDHVAVERNESPEETLERISRYRP
jgi:putative ABC transport system ATP-binding protein